MVAHETLRAGAEAAQEAERLWKMGELPKEDRNPFAKALARDTLEKIGIEITPQIDMIIAGIIEVVCILLPHETKM